MPDAAPIRTAIIEDDEVARDCLRLLVGGTPGYECVGAFGSVEEALREGFRVVPDVLLLDINLPGMPGSEGVRLFHERHPRLHILMLTVYAEQDRVFESICNGACGYLLKKTPPARLLESLNEAIAGGAPMSPEVALRVINLFREIRPPERADYNLTPHETRLLKLFVEGHNYKTAAAELGVSVHTVSFHLRSIYEKLQVHSKSEAVAKALRNRLV